MALRDFFRSEPPQSGLDLVGPRADNREKTPDAHSTQIVDESGNTVPLYHALLENPNSPVVDKKEVERAKSLLSVLIAKNSEIVLGCEGKTMTEAQEILQSLEDLREVA